MAEAGQTVQYRRIKNLNAEDQRLGGVRRTVRQVKEALMLSLSNYGVIRAPKARYNHPRPLRILGGRCAKPFFRDADSPSVAPDEPDKFALDAHTIGAVQPGFVGGIGCLERDGVAATT